MNENGQTPRDDAMARDFAGLVPLLRELERAEAELTPVFVAALRARLVASEEPRRPRAAVGGRRVLAALAAVTAIAVLVLIVVRLTHQPASRVPVATIKVPYPTVADLTFSYPAPRVVIRRVAPTVSLIHPVSGIPYAGRLRLAGGRLPSTPTRLRAFRLGVPPDFRAFPHRLGIRTGMRRVVVGGTPWALALDRGRGSHGRLHSIAVSLASGELIYHDRRNFVLPRSLRALPRRRAAAAARSWLVRLGYPGQLMPLRAADIVPGMPKVREVTFGWNGAGASATEAATLWVTPDRSVVEAWVWPPVVQSGFVMPASIATAWADVRLDKLPLAVLGVPLGTRAPGTGVLKATRVLYVLTVAAHGGAYLVPAYRFEGTVTLDGPPKRHAWYALAPAASP